VIEIKDLVKKYGSHSVLKKISFSAKEGEVLGFLGPNGAGKSTTMNILTGYLSSTSGTVKIAGYDIMNEPIEAKKQIGYLPEIPPLYVDMTVKSYLKFIYGIKKIKLPREEHINDIMKKVKIDAVANRILKNLSKGYRQRVGLAGALLGNPPILILDEPTVGLDPKQIIEIRDLIKELKQNRTVILSSHILTEVQAVCDRILIINQGRIVADDTAESLSAGIEKDHMIYALIEGDKSQVVSVIQSIPNVIKVSVQKQKEPSVFEYQIETDPNHDIRRVLFNTLAAHNMPMIGLKTGSLSLEEVFLKITETANILNDVKQESATQNQEESPKEREGEVS
jgi:ABC-2 type transport system ATP-binding protein